MPGPGPGLIVMPNQGLLGPSLGQPQPTGTSRRLARPPGATMAKPGTTAVRCAGTGTPALQTWRRSRNAHDRVHEADCGPHQHEIRPEVVAAWRTDGVGYVRETQLGLQQGSRQTSGSADTRAHEGSTNKASIGRMDCLCIAVLARGCGCARARACAFSRSDTGRRDGEHRWYCGRPPSSAPPARAGRG